jgi:class 3 adenylate cyclase
MRIGSLMKVGFGGAGVEIIRKSLGRDQQHNMLTLTSQGSKVSCIFLFCDIRSFTDATECLQEEVFVFTNQIAAVVHSYCAAYGGSANKNVGDAFLMSWKLDDLPDGRSFTAKQNQADKALLAVVRMCIALRYDDFYLKGMSEFARDALVTKFSARGGPIVQMGFGLHAGTAVQGAIGSQKKIDATYVGQAVEHSEFLESSTKKYGLSMLMSEGFHGLLDQRNKRRCRKIDQISLVDVDDNDDYDDDYQPEVTDLLTFDIDIDAWWDTGSVVNYVGTDPENEELLDSKRKKKGRKMSLFSGSNDEREDQGPAEVTASVSEPFTILNPLATKKGRTKQKKYISSSGSFDGSEDEDIRKSAIELDQGKIVIPSTPKKGISARTKEGLIPGSTEKDNGTDTMPKFGFGKAKRRFNNILSGGNDEVDGSGMFVKGVADVIANKDAFRRPEYLIPPKGPVLYNPNVWFSDDMRKIRERYSDGLFFQKFNSGLQAFYNKDWKYATECFSTILSRFEDGPSRHFLTQIEDNAGKPPPGFKPYGSA